MGKGKDIMSYEINPVYSRKLRKTITFDGSAGSGAVGTVLVGTVTGEVVIKRIIPYCTTDLTQASATATASLGVTSKAALFIASTTATAIDANEFWVDSGPDPNGIAIPAALKDIAITDNIIITVGSQAINGGVLEFDIVWEPISEDGDVS